MRGFLIDTCAISEFIKDAPNLGLVEWMSRADSSTVYLSALTLGELRYGVALQHDRRKRNRLEQWLQSDVLRNFSGRILPFDAEVAERWGRVRADARKAGSPIPTIDAMIAATAIHYNVAVVTRNEDDFSRTGVVVINPWR